MQKIDKNGEVTLVKDTYENKFEDKWGLHFKKEIVYGENHAYGHKEPEDAYIDSSSFHILMPVDIYASISSEIKQDGSQHNLDIVQEKNSNGI